MKMIVREVNGLQIRQRAKDGYINTTELCKAANKRWNNYWRQQGTQEFLLGLSEDLNLLVVVNNPVTLIPATALIQLFQGGNNQP
jgi:KilA-N domain